MNSVLIEQTTSQKDRGEKNISSWRGRISLILIRKKTSEEELTTTHPEKRCFFHLCPSDL
jgi:hypothetical protein